MTVPWIIFLFLLVLVNPLLAAQDWNEAIRENANHLFKLAEKYELLIRQHQEHSVILDPITDAASHLIIPFLRSDTQRCDSGMIHNSPNPPCSFSSQAFT